MFVLFTSFAVKLIISSFIKQKIKWIVIEVVNNRLISLFK